MQTPTQRIISQNTPITPEQYAKMLRDSVEYWGEERWRLNRELQSIPANLRRMKTHRRIAQNLHDLIIEAIGKREAYKTALMVFEQFVAPNSQS